MKPMTQTVLVATIAMVAFAGAVQAGRGVDNAGPVSKGAAVERAANAADGYTGRPNESVAIAPVRSEGNAEFAVMDVQGGAAGGKGVYHGRPMDNPAR